MAGKITKENLAKILKTLEKSDKKDVPKKSWRKRKPTIVEKPIRPKEPKGYVPRFEGKPRPKTEGPTKATPATKMAQGGSVSSGSAGGVVKVYSSSSNYKAGE